MVWWGWWVHSSLWCSVATSRQAWIRSNSLKIYAEILRNLFGHSWHWFMDFSGSAHTGSWIMVLWGFMLFLTRIERFPITFRSVSSWKTSASPISRPISEGWWVAWLLQKSSRCFQNWCHKAFRCCLPGPVRWLSSSVLLAGNQSPSSVVSGSTYIKAYILT